MRKIAAIVLLLSAALSEPGRADYLRLGGRIDATFFRPDGSVETKQVIPFDIFLTETGERWMIRSRFEPGREWHDETEGIGQAVYSVHYDPAANPGSSLSANVYPGYYPYWYFYHVTVPWIVFCSSEYFKHEAPENLPFPSFNAAWEGRAYAFKAEVRFLSNTVLKLPDSIEWTADADRIASANRSKTLRVPPDGDYLQRMDLRYLVKVGLVAGKYTVSSVTNFNGLLLPESFHFEQYSCYRLRKPGQPLEKPDQLLFKEFRQAIFDGHLESIELLTGSLEPPRFPRSVAVADYRLSDRALRIACVPYTITNGYWKTEIDRDMRRIFELQKKNAKSGGTSGLNRLAMPALVFALIAVPVLILLFVRRGRQAP